MVKLRVLSGKEVCAILTKAGFEEVRRRGSHIIMQKRMPLHCSHHRGRHPGCRPARPSAGPGQGAVSPTDPGPWLRRGPDPRSQHGGGRGRDGRSPPVPGSSRDGALRPGRRRAVRRDIDRRNIDRRNINRRAPARGRLSLVPHPGAGADAAPEHANPTNTTGEPP